MKRRRKRKCQHCGVGFVPSPQNAQKQQHCSASECKKASTRAANQRWVGKNPNYHSGESAIARVQEWRAINPGYWRPKTESLEPSTLQDDCIAEVVDDEQESATLKYFALQDDSNSQAFVVLGLIATLTGGTLQDDIAQSCRDLHKQGRQVLGTQSGVFASNHHTENHAKTSSGFKTPSPGAQPV
jgi:hypothetical protein